MKRLAPIIPILFVPMLLGAASRSFNGTNQNISMGNVLNVTTGSVSMCIWAKTTEDASADRLIGKRNADVTTNAGYAIRQGSTDTNTAKADDGTIELSSGTATDYDAIWAKFCLTFDTTPNTAVLYENTTANTASTNAAFNSMTNAINFVIGEDAAGGNDANGQMAFGVVYLGKVLSDVEIAELQYNPEGVTGANGLWPLWGDSPEIDISGNGVTGTVTGATTSIDGPPISLGMMLPL